MNMILDIPTKTLNTIQARINRFIWQNKRLRLKIDILQQKVSSGGLSVSKREA